MSEVFIVLASGITAFAAMMILRAKSTTMALRPVRIEGRRRRARRRK